MADNSLGGYVSLGQSAFVGVGAYTVALGALKVGGDPFLWVPVAGAVGGLLALFMGFIAMCTRGHSFVILTIAALFLLQIIAINWSSLTNGTLYTFRVSAVNGTKLGSWPSNSCSRIP